MTSTVVLAFFAVTLAWFTLPFLPGLVELWRRRDAAPLQVIAEYDVDVHHFAQGLRQHVLAPLAEALSSGVRHDGLLPDGKAYTILPPAGDVGLTPAEHGEQVVQRLLLSASALSLPGGISYLGEIYSAASIRGGAGDIYRALLADGDIALAPASMVLRWLHANGSVQAPGDCVLHGRASADHTLRLNDGCHFERLHAPIIEFGPPVAAPPRERLLPPLDPAELGPGIAVEVTGRRWLIEQDFEVPSGRLVDADLVVVGTLRIGAGSLVTGAIKSHRDLTIDRGACVDAAVVAGCNLLVASDCRIGGPVIAESLARFGAGCRVGTPTAPTTVSAERIRCAVGSVMHGTVWARAIGEVVPAGEET
jgi:hypothetical protein